MTCDEKQKNTVATNCLRQRPINDNLYKNCEDILYMSSESTDKYDKLGASVEKEINHKQMLKKRNKNK